MFVGQRDRSEPRVGWSGAVSHRRCPALAAIVLVMLAAGASAADDAHEAFERGDYMNAHRLFLPLAKDGDAGAQFRLGVIYDEGGGCKKNYILMRRRIQRGCPPDPVEAIAWLRRAAAQNHPEALAYLGALFAEGREGVPPDPVEAFTLTQRAAAQGHPGALYRLGRYLEDGSGTAPDPGAALTAYRSAAAAGSEEARKALVRLGFATGGEVPAPRQALAAPPRPPAPAATPATPDTPTLPPKAGARPDPPARKPGQALAVEPQARKSAPVVAGKPDRVDRIPDIDFGRYHALVIGNNGYRSLPRLRTAIADAKAVARMLEDAYGFETTLLLDATRSDIVSALSRYRRTLGEGDNLLIYYAGHGWNDQEAAQGYWLPVDARKDDETAWIANGTVTSILRALPAKHAMIVADSCYSGTLTRGINMRPDGRAFYEKLVSRRARTALTSGGVEPVEDGSGDHSVFASAFLKVLGENDGVLDATTLFGRLRRPVMLESDQSPQYGDIRRAGHEDGDFLFVRR